jgi:hypothetical protein
MTVDPKTGVKLLTSTGASAELAKGEGDTFSAHAAPD